MSYSQYAREKATLLASGNALLFATDASLPFLYESALIHDLLSFTIYPTSDAHLALNDLLWQLAHAKTFSAPMLSALLPQCAPSHIPFAIALSMPLARFLSAVSLSEMRAAVIYMLADAAQGEDAEGLDKMRAELPSSVWGRLTALMEQTAGQRTAGLGVGEGAPPGITRASFLLDAALQTAPCNDYWKISVDVAFAVPVESGGVLTNSDPDDSEIAEECDWRCVPRPVCARDARGNKSSESAVILQSLYTDWRRYADICSGIRPSPSKGTAESIHSRYTHAFALMTQLVGTSRQGQTWQRVEALRCCARKSGSFLSWLPCQIIEQVLVPRVVILEGKDAEDTLKKSKRKELRTGGMEVSC